MKPCWTILIAAGLVGAFVGLTVEVGRMFKRLFNLYWWPAALFTAFAVAAIAGTALTLWLCDQLRGCK